jgi:hypothetical protein
MKSVSGKDIEKLILALNCSRHIMHAGEDRLAIAVNGDVWLPFFT